MRQIFRSALLLAAFTACTSTSKSPAPRAPATEPGEEAERPQSLPPGSVANGPYDDCDQRGLYEKHEEMNWICTGNYVHIYSTKPFTRVRSNRAIKIGAFNMYHLGDDQSRIKDMRAMALLMNEWDLVGATELMPLPSTYADENRKLREVVAIQGSDNLPPEWRVVEPGYYKLLKALQKIDSSWSLIFQPMPEGEGSTGEMAGFYYRAKKVQLKMWNYCDQAGLNDKINPNVSGLNFGCVVRVPEQQAKLMSRKAFVAAFKSNKFDFIGAVAHARFRPASDENLKLQQTEICGRYQGTCSISKDKVGRFYEVKAVADQFPILEKFDNDIIYMGDFNLDVSAGNQAAWNASIAGSPGYQVYQAQNTSLSLPLQKLANSYDHFIFRQDSLKECDLKSIRLVDFTQIGAAPTETVLQKLSYLLLPATHFQAVSDQTNFLEQQIRLEKVKGTYVARALNDEEKAVGSADIQRSVNRLNNNKFWILREYLSDHIPVEMACSTTRDDD